MPPQSAASYAQQVCRGYGDSHGDSHGYGYGMGMGIKIQSPLQPCRKHTGQFSPKMLNNAGRSRVNYP